MSTKVVRYRCDVCGALFDREDAALGCEAKPVTGDDFQLGDEILGRHRDTFHVVRRHIRRMAKVSGETYHLAFYEIEGPYTWEGKPRLTSAKYLRQRGFALRGAARP